jgi:hypothetical protein
MLEEIVVENGNDLKKLVCLDNSREYLEALKLSSYGKILFAFNKKSTYISLNEETPPNIFFWETTEKIGKFKLINKISIKHKYILDAEFSPLNNMCAVLSIY